jgi:hydroxylamine reductase (hybrid-cluster protein)
MAELLNEKLGLKELLGLCLKVGEANVTVMASLDNGHAQFLGTPEPTDYSRAPV